jgi:hypothetical protein
MQRIRVERMHDQGRRKPALLFPVYEMTTTGSVVAHGGMIHHLPAD